MLMREGGREEGMSTEGNEMRTANMRPKETTMEQREERNAQMQYNATPRRVEEVIYLEEKKKTDRKSLKRQ
jgi:hypothetical protein